MAELQRQLGAAVSGFVGSDGVQLALRVVGVYLIALWLAAAWWAFRDAENRTGNRGASYVAAAWVILFSPAFFPFALLIYRLVRPPELLADVEDRRLTAEALLADDLEDRGFCPRCGRAVEPAWIACPSCRLVLARLCPSCGRAATLDWQACAWCGEGLANEEPGRRTERGLVPVMVGHAPALAAATAAPTGPSVEIPADLDVDPPPFITPRPRPRRLLRPVERRLQRRTPAQRDERRAGRQTA